MGANEKHAATYHVGKYTPGTLDVNNCYRQRWYEQSEAQSDAEFTRWLETVRAEAKAEVLHEVLTVLNAEIEDAPPANYEEDNYEAGYIDGLMFAEEFTETRADQYKENRS